MKNILSYLLCLTASISLFSQSNIQQATSINSDGSAPATSAILDVNSTDKGMLVPRMSTSQRDALSNPALGLLIYNLTDSCFNYFNGTEWLKDCGADLNADTLTTFRAGGGNNHDIGGGITVDAFGNTIVTGSFQGTATFDTVTLTSTGGYDIFLAKYDPSGNVLWAKKGGGNGGDSAGDIAVDAAGNVYVIGYFSDVATFGSQTLTSAGSHDVFVVKYSPSGSILWAVKGGGVSGDEGYGIAVDATSNVYISGGFGGTATFGTEMLTSLGSSDVFVVKYNPSGNVLWAVKAGGGMSDFAFNLRIDATGNSFVTGYFQGTASFGAITLTSSFGGFDFEAFTAKYDPSGNVLWAVQSSGNGRGEGNKLAVDLSGNIFLAGTFTSSITFDAITLNSAGSDEVFTVKYNSSGTVLWAKKGGGSTDDAPRGMATDFSGNVLVTGRFTGTATFDTAMLVSAGSHDVFLGKYDPSGNLLWAKRGGGGGFETSLGVATDGIDNVLVTGGFEGMATFSTTTLTSTGSSDVFVWKLSPSGSSASSPANNPSSSNSLSWFFFNTHLLNQNTGNVGIGRIPFTNKLEIEGNASKTSAGDWLANSDARLKKNIQPLNSMEMLEKMLALQGISYEWNDNKTGSARPEGVHFGFTAQNIQEVFPSLVEQDALGYLQTAYGTYDAMMVEAIKELNDKIKSQQTEIEGLKKLETENTTLKAQLETQAAQLQKITAALQDAGIPIEN